MFRLLWLQHVTTEGSLMARSIKLHSMLMNWMCFPLQVWGNFAQPAKTRGGSEGQRPQAKIEQKSKSFRFFESLPLPFWKKQELLLRDAVTKKY